jgi:hypothetical protein
MPMVGELLTSPRLCLYMRASFLQKYKVSDA